ncbi:MAG TPA: hypothetical protein VHL31_15750 [Geminicoccus sp.]|jgi:hypothetical protein|uniref:hypothetical protein n=1 Tax=Geminicoccus sp. TaxID=2024832 RepID=UPI002E2F218D|nr:hypothetical protein [Geminicoccus sp.]HEX2527737.1 hypothetical protein [Geminicoccus sp.]
MEAGRTTRTLAALTLLLAVATACSGGCEDGSTSASCNVGSTGSGGTGGMGGATGSSGSASGSGAGGGG